MGRRLGNFLMVLGALLLLGALGLFGYNQWQAYTAEMSTVNLLPQVLAQIDRQTPEEEEPEATAPISGPTEPLFYPGMFDMTEVEIEGNLYIGCLAIPSLVLELPVMSSWDYSKLNVAPCRYYGSTKSDDLVVVAHNFPYHFGQVKDLQPGDTVYFTDMDGIVSQYAVEAVDILPPTAVEEVTAGDFDLTLLTCTYGGKTRVAVWCDRSSGAE